MKPLDLVKRGFRDEVQSERRMCVESNLELARH